MFSKILIKLLLILLITGLASQSVFFASAQTSTLSARKFDEFGDAASSDKKARLDNFANQLQNEPNVRAFLIVYRSRRDLPGLSSRLAKWMRDYLIYSRGLSAERVIALDGGAAGCLTQELWIAPIGTAPISRSDAYSNDFIDTESARKFDEYYYTMLQDREEGEEAGDSLEAFGAALRKEPHSQAYIIAYPQYYIERWGENVSKGKTRKHQRTDLDPPHTALKMLRTIKADLVSRYHIAPSRISLKDGGYRKERQLELWIVPHGVHAPIATPNAFPNRHINVRLR